MANSSVTCRLSDTESAYLDKLATRHMSYRNTIARRLLSEKIAEMMADDQTEPSGATDGPNGEESTNGE